MAGGSQLTQLKAALSSTGITRQPTGKKRKRSSSKDSESEKRAQKLKELHQKFNPFSLKVTKVKKDIGGRKLKGVTGRPFVSNQAGIEQVCKIANFRGQLTTFKHISGRKHYFRSINKKAMPVVSLIAALEKMIPLYPSKSECSAGSRRRGSVFPKLMSSI